MASTFHGLETAKRGLYTQQSAINTTGHNISNANTPGYSRQRVNFEQTEPYPPASINRPEMPGQMGTGVEAGSIQRVREKFLDLQYRGENNKVGYYETKAEALEKMEDILNEPTDEGLANTIDQFWESIQDLSTNPAETGPRSVVRQRGQALVETFNYLSDSLTSIQQNYNQQIGVKEKEVNSVLQQINNLNKQIGEVEPNGYLPNDLYDERDRLVDQLSGLVNIKVDYVGSGGQSLDIADGKVNIYLIGQDGAVLKNDGGTDIQLVDASTDSFTGIEVQYDGVTNLVSEIKLNGLMGGSVVNNTEFQKAGGEFASVIESYGYMDGASEKGLYPSMLEKLDELAFRFADEFNTQHEAGYGLNGSHGITNSFFDLGTATAADYSGLAGSIKLDAAINDLDNIAAAASDPAVVGKGDNGNALNLADVKDANLGFTTGNGSMQSFYQGEIIGQLGVDTQEAQRLQNNSEVLRDSVEQNKLSVSGVSLDEEMANLIQFQHAYNASARNITAVDEMIDRIINRMGRVGL